MTDAFCSLSPRFDWCLPVAPFDHTFGCVVSRGLCLCPQAGKYLHAACTIFQYGSAEEQVAMRWTVTFCLQDPVLHVGCERVRGWVSGMVLVLVVGVT
jgi:hypothetical protein